MHALPFCLCPSLLRVLLLPPSAPPSTAGGVPPCALYLPYFAFGPHLLRALLLRHRRPLHGLRALALGAAQGLLGGGQPGVLAAGCRWKGNGKMTESYAQVQLLGAIFALGNNPLYVAGQVVWRRRWKGS